jgi:hypothetical protein
LTHDIECALKDMVAFIVGGSGLTGWRAEEGLAFPLNPLALLLGFSFELALFFVCCWALSSGDFRPIRAMLCSLATYVCEDSPDPEAHSGASAKIAAICGIWAGVNLSHNDVRDVLCFFAREGGSCAIAGVHGVRRHEADGELAALGLRQTSELPNRLHLRRLAGSSSTASCPRTRGKQSGSDS